jgi:ataxia telangiectasia mutated family protein
VSNSYRPQDWLSIDCRKKLAAASEREKLDVYKQITENFKPVFHHFFLERFPNPAHWFERRLAYTRSVATGSMVGYMLGLGDRYILRFKNFVIF